MLSRLAHKHTCAWKQSLECAHRIIGNHRNMASCFSSLVSSFPNEKMNSIPNKSQIMSATILCSSQTFHFSYFSISVTLYVCIKHTRSWGEWIDSFSGSICSVIIRKDKKYAYDTKKVDAVLSSCWLIPTDYFVSLDLISSKSATVLQDLCGTVPDSHIGRRNHVAVLLTRYDFYGRRNVNNRVACAEFQGLSYPWFMAGQKGSNEMAKK